MPISCEVFVSEIPPKIYSKYQKYKYVLPVTSPSHLKVTLGRVGATSWAENSHTLFLACLYLHLIPILEFQGIQI